MPLYSQTALWIHVTIISASQHMLLNCSSIRKIHPTSLDAPQAAIWSN